MRKILIPSVLTIETVQLRISEIQESFPLAANPVQGLVDRMRDADPEVAAIAASRIEHVFWPLKIEDARVPSFIVPIRPEWAKHLFDEGLSKDDLFGADQGLAMNREGVYYRSRRPGGITAPARLLWYVSREQGEIRACSNLIEVRVDTPKTLFKQFERLGVYTWERVFETANWDLNEKIMAFRFGDTVLLKNPLSWSEFQTILQEEGCPSQIQAPHKIPPRVFSGLYRMGL